MTITIHTRPSTNRFRPRFHLRTMMAFIGFIGAALGFEKGIHPHWRMYAKEAEMQEERRSILESEAMRESRDVEMF